MSMEAYKEQFLVSLINDWKHEIEIYEDCLKYADKHNVYADIERYDEMKKHAHKRIEEAEAQLQQLKSA